MCTKTGDVIDYCTHFPALAQYWAIAGKPGHLVKTVYWFVGIGPALVHLQFRWASIAITTLYILGTGPVSARLLGSAL